MKESIAPKLFPAAHQKRWRTAKHWIDGFDNRDTNSSPPQLSLDPLFQRSPRIEDSIIVAHRFPQSLLRTRALALPASCSWCAIFWDMLCGWVFNGHRRRCIYHYRDSLVNGFVYSGASSSSQYNINKRKILLLLPLRPISLFFYPPTSSPSSMYDIVIKINLYT